MSMVSNSMRGVHLALADVGECEPTSEDLDAIDREMPLLLAEADVLLLAVASDGDDLAERRRTRARRRMNAAACLLASRSGTPLGVA